MKIKTGKPFYELMPKSPSNWLFGELRNQFVGKMVPVYNLNDKQIGTAKVLDDLSLEIDTDLNMTGVKSLFFVGRIKENDVGGYDVEINGFKIVPEISAVDAAAFVVSEPVVSESSGNYDELLDLASEFVLKFYGNRRGVKLATEMMGEFCRELVKRYRLERKVG